MSLKISVAMATYNGEKYIREQLESIANQGYLPCELVVCDDCSSDDTENIINDFSKSAPFPVYFYKNKNNLGFSNNFFKCISLCSGDWIALSDQDDVWLSHKLSTIKCTIENNLSNNLVLIAHSANLTDENLIFTGRRLPDFKSNYIKKKNSNPGFFCIAGFAVVFKRELVLDIDANLRPGDDDPEEKFQSHDKWISILANSCGEISYIAESLVLYRRHPAAYSGLHDEISIKKKFEKRLSMGADFYQFRSNLAKETATTFKLISNSLSLNDERKKCLLITAKKFNNLSKVYSLRAKFYTSNDIYLKIKILFVLLINKGYFGSSFLSLGIHNLILDFLSIWKIIFLSKK